MISFKYLVNEKVNQMFLMQPRTSKIIKIEIIWVDVNYLLVILFIIALLLNVLF